MKLLTKEQQESYKNAKICYICKEKIENKYLKDKKKFKVRDHCHYTGEYRGAVYSICSLKYSLPKKNHYDYHFIIKDLAEERKKQFTCLQENTEKYIAFIVPIEKEATRINKKWKRNYKKYILHITIYSLTHHQIVSIILLREFID